MQINSNIGNNLLKPQHSKLLPVFPDVIGVKDLIFSEKEIDLFLSVSLAVGSAKSKDELEDNLSQELHRFLSINDFILFVINSDKKTYSSFFRGKEKQAEGQRGFSDILNETYLINDGLFDRVLVSETYYWIKINETIVNESTPEYVCYWRETGYEEVLALPIRKGTENVGVLLMRIDNEKGLKPINFRIANTLSSQIAAKISEITARAEIERRERAMELLLSLNADIGNVGNCDELLPIIVHRLKKLLSFSHTTITIINDDRITISPFLSDSDSETMCYPHYNKSNSPKIPIYDGIMDRAISSPAPIVLDLGGTGKISELPIYIKVNYERGIRQAVIVRFSKCEEAFGFWTIYFEDGSHIGKDLLSLISALANQLSIAVLNIIANEALTKREEETALLNSLSNEIAALRYRNDLFRMANERIKKLFSISEFGIAQINEDRKTYSVFVLELNESIRSPDDFNKITSDNYNITDPVFSSVMRSDEPVLFRVAEWVNVPEVPAYVWLWESAGLTQVLCAALRVGGNAIGFVYLHIDDELILTHKYNLLKGVCAQLAMAFSNIIAIEEIARRESEREVLLSLNTNIAAVRSNAELLHVINSRLKGLLGFNHTLIGIVNEDGNTASAFLIDPETIAKSHPVFESARDGKYPIRDGVMDKAAVSPIPLIYDLGQLKEKQVLPIYFQLNYESGIRHAVITRFSNGEEAFGFWMIFYDNDSCNDTGILSLIAGLASQISIAVSNIIANEEIKRRELEKSKILTFSNAIASVRDRNVLAKILTCQLKELFNIEDYVIYAISEDKKTHRAILYDLDATFASHPDFQQMLNSETAITDLVLNRIIDSADPVTFNVDELFNSKKALHFMNSAKADDSKKIVGVSIKLAEEPIAIMIFRRDQFDKFAIQRSLFRSICSQIAITVANILANEKVDRQLSEINRYKKQLEEEKTYLKEEIESTQNYSEIIGNSAEIQGIFQMVGRVAVSDSTVLLLGETGTGKELIARAIHNGSPRKSRLMIKVNCAALPANLIESELFGHERGSFTGAIERRIGKFELANNGTLFLDEIGEMPLDLQVKLLRALQEREIERVGGKNTIKVDVRIIAATNRDLEKEMREGRFRSDLYYRLNIFPIHLPPLRERKQDIPALAAYFIDRLGKKAGKNITGISKRVLQQLAEYSWPGNIRELEHLIERSVLLTTGETIKQINLPGQSQGVQENLKDKIIVIKTIDEFERGHILETLKFCKGRIAGRGGAAELLGIPASTLNSKMKKLGIKKEHSV